MPPPINHKEYKSLIKKLSYIHRFILGLAAMNFIYTHLFKKKIRFVWSNKEMCIKSNSLM